MSAFDDHYAGVARPLLKEQFGDAVTYTHSDGTQTACTAVLGAESVEENFQDSGRSHRRQRHVTLFKDEVATVSMGGSLTINGEKWPVDDVLEETATETQLSVVRIEPVEISRPNFRSQT